MRKIAVVNMKGGVGKTQRFDRSRLLRILRRGMRECAPSAGGLEALTKAIEAIRLLDIPHLDRFEDVVDEELVH